MLRTRFLSFLCLCFVSTVTIADASVQIFVNPGSFENIEKAAISEKEVDFWDNDLTDDNACTECFAATELRKYLSACTTIKDINLSWGKELPDSEYVFVLGNRVSNHLIKQLDADSRKLNSPESFSITSITRGTSTICIIEGYDRVGTLYGVYEYLGHLGMRFFGLGEQGTVYPHKLAALPCGMNLIEYPGFFTRGYYAWESRGNEELFLWMARNRMNYWTAEQKEVHFLKKLGIRLCIGQHHELQNIFLNPHAEYPYDSPLLSGDEHKPKDPYTPSTEYVGDLTWPGQKILHWSSYLGAGNCTLTIAPGYKSKHSGKLVATEWYEKNNRRQIGVGLIIGVSDGYNGRNVPKILPMQKYYFSFWMKGTAPNIAVQFVTWDETGKLNTRVVTDTTLGALSPSREWELYNGSFITSKSAARGALRINISGYEDKGASLGEFCVDNVYVGLSDRRAAQSADGESAFLGAQQQEVIQKADETDLANIAPNPSAEELSTTYFALHPEWYGLHDGKRSNNNKLCHGDNFCTSNRDAVRELSKNLIRGLIDGSWRYADIVDLYMFDLARWCQCESCKKLGTPTDRLLLFVHQVNQAIQKAQREGRLKRDIQVATLAYTETLSPPTRPLPENFHYKNFYITFYPISRCYVHALADPSCTEINRQHREDYLGWMHGFYKGSICVGEYYNVSGIQTLPVLYPRIMAADIPWYHRTGSRHFHYMHVPGRLWGTWTLNQWLLSRLLWNPGVDAEALLEEYFRLYYPTTSQHTREFYRHLENATANIKAIKYLAGKHAWLAASLALVNSFDSNLFPIDHLHYETHSPEINDGPDMVDIIELMHRARAALDQSLLECADPKEKARLLEDEARFAFGESMFDFFYHMVRVVMFRHRGDGDLARREFVYLKRAAEELEAITDLVHVSYGHPATWTGLDATYTKDRYKALKQELESKPGQRQ